MQSGVLRNAVSASRYATRTRSLTAGPSSRRHVSFRPLDWIRKRMLPSIRKPEPEAKVAAAKKQAVQKQGSNIFETITAHEREKATEKITTADPFFIPEPKKPQPTFHKYSTKNFKISYRKLNDLGRQISGKPIDYAILQMQFSEKRASERIRAMLQLAKSHAVAYKRLDGSKLVVAESWVNKGPRRIKRPDFRGRAHFGIQRHPDSRMHVVLKEGKSIDQIKQEERAKKLRKIVSASIVREDRPIRNPQPNWAW